MCTVCFPCQDFFAERPKWEPGGLGRIKLLVWSLDWILGCEVGYWSSCWSTTASNSCIVLTLHMQGRLMRFIALEAWGKLQWVLRCSPYQKGNEKRAWKGLGVFSVLYEPQLSLLEGWQEPVGEKQIQELKWLKLCGLNRRKGEGVCSDEGNESDVLGVSHSQSSCRSFSGFLRSWCRGDASPPVGVAQLPRGILVGLSQLTRSVCV